MFEHILLAPGRKIQGDGRDVVPGAAHKDPTGDGTAGGKHPGFHDSVGGRADDGHAAREATLLGDRGRFGEDLAVGKGTTAPDRSRARAPVSLLEGSDPALRKRGGDSLALPLAGVGVGVSEPAHIPRGDLTGARARV